MSNGRGPLPAEARLVNSKNIPDEMKWIPEKLALIIGCAFLIIGATSTWFAVPIQDFAFRAGGFAPAPTRFQLPCQTLVGSLATALLIFRPLRSNARWRSVVAQLCLLTVLIFPHLVMVWDPERSMRASYLYQQSIYLNRQVSLGFSQIQVDWMRSSMFEPLDWDGEAFPLVQTPLGPFQIKFIDALSGSALRPLNGYPIDPVQFSLVDSYLHGIGYNDAFLQSAGKGFFVSAIGALFLILSACLLAIQPIKTLGTNLITVVTTSSLALSLCVIPIFVAAHEVDKADTLAAQGMYDAAIKALERASQILPVLEANMSFHRLRGELLVRTECVDDPDHHLVMALQLVRERRLEEAIWKFRNASLADGRHNPLFRLILAHVLFNEAVTSYNISNFTKAFAGWQTVLQYDPAHMAALTHLAIASIAQTNTELAQRYADQVLTIQGYFQHAFKPVSSIAVMIKAWGFFKEGQLGKALEYVVKSKDGSQL